MRPDLALLAARAQRGDVDAYRILLDACRTWLMAFFRRRLPLDRVEDAVQETLISVHAKRATYDPLRPFLPWLAAIARYRWADQLRGLYHDDRLVLPADPPPSSVEDQVTARHSLMRLLERIPARQAEVIRLVRIEGCTISEAARRTGQSEALVKVNIHRGLRRLTHLIETSE